MPCLPKVLSPAQSQIGAVLVAAALIFGLGLQWNQSTKRKKMQFKKNGRPMSAIAVELLAMVQASGSKGMSTTEIRNAFPDHQDNARHAAINFAHRGYLFNKRHGRMTVYYGLNADPKEIEKHFSERIADRKEIQAEMATVRKIRYLEKIQSLTADKRAQKERLDAIRAARRAQVESEKALRRQQREERAQLRKAVRDEIKHTNVLAKSIIGTTSGIVQVADQPKATEDWGSAKVHKEALRPGRYEVLEVPGIFRRLPPGKYPFEPTTCAARAA